MESVRVLLLGQHCLARFDHSLERAAVLGDEGSLPPSDLDVRLDLWPACGMQGKLILSHEELFALWFQV